MSHSDKPKPPQSASRDDENPADPDRAAILARRNLFIAMAMSGITAATALPACAGEIADDPDGSGGSAVGGASPGGNPGAGGALPCLTMLVGGTPGAGGALPCLSTGGSPSGGAAPCLSLGGAMPCLDITGGFTGAGGAVPCLSAPLGGSDAGAAGAQPGDDTAGTAGALTAGAMPCLSVVG